MVLENNGTQIFPNKKENNSAQVTYLSVWIPNPFLMLPLHYITPPLTSGIRSDLLKTLVAVAGVMCRGSLRPSLALGLSQAQSEIPPSPYHCRTEQNQTMFQSPTNRQCQHAKKHIGKISCFNHKGRRTRNLHWPHQSSDKVIIHKIGKTEKGNVLPGKTKKRKGKNNLGVSKR